MASRGSRAAVAVCLVVALVVTLQPASAARPLPPATSWNAPSSVGEGHAAAAGAIDKYAPLLLAMLPRGPVTPSGPSGGTNNSGN
ncbi:hypothetical protein ABZP36_031036 [Zizania latifolia]